MSNPPRSTPRWNARVILGDRTDDRNNNFDTLRLFAAWAVLVSHSFGLLGIPEPLHQFNTSLGNVGVLIFFAVSGLLIRRSWEKDPSPRDFWIKRGLRLIPGLFVVSMLTAFVLGPLVTKQSPSEYFSAMQTWIYPLRVTLLVPFGATLPGVFTGNVYGAVNGPLWSLPVEVSAYLALSVLGILGLLRHRRFVGSLALVALVWAGIWDRIMPPAIGVAYVLAAFALGAACYSFRERIVLWWPIALGLLALSWLTGPTPLRAVVWTITACYVSYWFAYALPPIGRALTRVGDASYGIYIYAFPIQQTIVQVFGDKLNPYTLILAATVMVWPLAQLSWHLVEAPALRRKPQPRRLTSDGTGS